MRAQPSPHSVTDEDGYQAAYFRTMIEAQAVDVVMADATRCGGVSGFLKVGSLRVIPDTDVFALRARATSHPGCALPSMRHAGVFSRPRPDRANVF